MAFQLILNPTRDWNYNHIPITPFTDVFQLILNPTRDWNPYLNSPVFGRFDSSN